MIWLTSAVSAAFYVVNRHDAVPHPAQITASRTMPWIGSELQPADIANSR